MVAAQEMIKGAAAFAHPLVVMVVVAGQRGSGLLIKQTVGVLFPKLLLQQLCQVLQQLVGWC